MKLIMKRFFILILSLSCLCSCSNPKSGNSSTTEEDFKKEWNRLKSRGEISQKNKPLYNPLDRELKIDFDYKEIDGLVFFIGTTNLPTGTKLGIDVTDNRGYKAQDQVIVINNRFKSIGFSHKGSKLKGKYNVRLFTYFSKFWQKKPILKTLDEYEGSLIKVDESEGFGKQRMIDLNKQIVFGSKVEVKNDLESSKKFQEEKALKKIKDDIRVLFNSLMAFKDNSDFHKYGFGVGYKYNKWLKEVQRLKSIPEAHLLFINQGFAVGDLEMLGREYMGSNGKETEYSLWAKKRILDGLR